MTDRDWKQVRRRKKARRRKNGTLQTKSSCCVYVLKDLDGRVRYVGQTRIEVTRRFRFHMKSARPDGSPIERWLVDNSATINVIDDTGIWDVSEVIWIERMRLAGEPLLNANLGGRDTGRRLVA